MSPFPHKQTQHEFLYWELSGQVAVRMGHWKAVKPRRRPDWELYDLRTDLEEVNSVAAQHPDVLAKMKAIVAREHEDAREGVFHNRAIHEKDRQAKWGDTRRPLPRLGKVHALPQKGLIPPKGYKLVRASSESRSNGKLARCAFDGEPRTWWHSKFADGVEKHPHELLLDLGGTHTIRGFRLLARQDSGWNGAIKDCEFCVSDRPDRFGAPVVKATLRKVKTAQEVTCPPTRARYVLLRALSEVNGGPWASLSELGVVGE